MIHAAINATPPSGVIAPRTLICVRLRTYKLPENKTIPANISHPAAETLPAPASFDAMSATTIKPSAHDTYDFYWTPVCQICRNISREFSFKTMGSERS